MPLAAIGGYLAAIGGYWRLLAAMAAIGGYGGYWRLLAAIGSYWRLLVAAIGGYWWHCIIPTCLRLLLLKHTPVSILAAALCVLQWTQQLLPVQPQLHFNSDGPLPCAAQMADL